MLWFRVLLAFGFFSVQIVSCISHVARYINSLLTPFDSPVIGVQKPSPAFNLSSKTISKSNKANL